MRHRPVIALFACLALLSGPALAAKSRAGPEPATPTAAPAPELRPQPDPASEAVTAPTPSPSPAENEETAPEAREPAAGDPGAEEPEAKDPEAGQAEATAPPAGPPVHETLAESDADFAACTAALTALGTRFETAPPVTDPAERDCGIDRPVTVPEILPGVALRPAAVLRCETARALAEWTRDFVVPAASRLPGRGKLSAIDHGTAYLCRPRNGISGEALSEHAFGNAIDIAGFRFAEGEALAVTPRAGDGSLDEAFQAAVRKTACLAFTTVLGPGADASHADHLHLDVKARRGGFRLCQ